MNDWRCDWVRQIFYFLVNITIKQWFFWLNICICYLVFKVSVFCLRGSQVCWCWWLKHTQDSSEYCPASHSSHKVSRQEASIWKIEFDTCTSYIFCTLCSRGMQQRGQQNSHFHFPLQCSPKKEFLQISLLYKNKKTCFWQKWQVVWTEYFPSLTISGCEMT